MRILFISFHSVSGDQPWARRSFNIIQALCDAGNELTVLAPQKKLALGLQKAELIPLVNVPVRGFRILTLLHAFFKSIVLLGSKKIEAVHFAGSAVCLYAFLPLIFRARIVYDVWRSAEVESDGSRPAWVQSLRSRLERAVLKNMDTITCASPMIEEELLAAVDPSRVRLIENALNKSNPTACDLGDRPVIVYEHEGRRPAGLAQVLRVMAKVRERVPNARMIICSDSVRMRKVDDLVARLELQRCCTFVPFGDSSIQSSLISSASVLLLPEGRGAYADERMIRYMQSGTPIVATRIRSHRQFLEESRAIMTAVGVDDLADGITRALREPLLSAGMAREAQSYAVAHFTRSGFNRKVRAVYSELSRG